MPENSEQNAEKLDPATQERFEKLQNVLKDDVFPIIKALDKSAYDVEMLTQAFSSAIQGAALHHVAKKRLDELEMTANLNAEHEDHATWVALMEKLGGLTVEDAQTIAGKLAQLVQLSISERAKEVKIRDLRVLGLE